MMESCQRQRFPRLASLDTVLWNVNGRVMGEKNVLCDSKFGNCQFNRIVRFVYCSILLNL